MNGTVSRWQRVVVAAVTVALVGAACASGDSSDLVAATTTSVGATTTTPTTEVTTTLPASSSSTEPTTEAPATTTSTTEAQAPLPDDCQGLDTPLVSSQLTYVADEKLIAVDLLGEISCLLDLGGSTATDIVGWGAQADRVMFSDGRVEVLGAKGRVGGEAGPDNLRFSWPTGFNMMWLVDGVVVKSTVDSRQQRELPLGFAVTEAVYHPDGQHLLLVSEDGPSSSTVFVSDSEGEGSVPLLFSGDAIISDLTVSGDGATIVFAARHDTGATHVHSLALDDAVEEVPVGDDDVERVLQPSDEVFVTTIFEAAGPIDGLVFDASGRQVAFAEGDCASGSAIELIDLVAGGYPLPIDPLFSARPVGFVTETQLAILVYDEDCVGGDLYVADTVTGDTQLVRAGVDSAAIRRSEPPAKFTLVDVNITGFA